MEDWAAGTGGRPDAILTSPMGSVVAVERGRKSSRRATAKSERGLADQRRNIAELCWTKYLKGYQGREGDCGSVLVRE